MEISYRKMKRKDFGFVQKLISSAWYDEYGFRKSTIKHYAKVYFYECYRQSNYEIVATLENEVIGFILGRYKSVSAFKKIITFFPLLFTAFLMIFTKEGRRGLRIGLKTDRIDESLKKETNKHFDGELKLFIVSKKYRSIGIGSKLQEDFIEYLKRKKAKNFYLYTDTYSDFAYYEKRGYVRLNTKTVDFGEGEDPLPEYYIYEKEL